MRTLFISDVHLGCMFARSEKLLNYLNSVKDEDRPERIYLVGDFIDGWKLKRNRMRFWGNKETLVIRKLLSMVKEGTEVVYVVGNHDEFLRSFMNGGQESFGDIKLVDEIIHTTADGRRLLVIHGDLFDASLRYAPWLAVLGDVGYEIMLRLNYVANWVQRKLFRGHIHWSLSQFLKHHVKKTVSVITSYEECLIRYAKQKGCDGVICGHIHTAEIRTVGDMWYYNTGDWVETCSSLVELESGELELRFHNSDTPDVWRKHSLIRKAC